MICVPLARVSKIEFLMEKPVVVNVKWDLWNRKLIQNNV